MQCPGQDNRYWDGEAVFEVPCPHCGNELEFFKDDSQRSCKKCGNRVLNPRIDFGCASYCSHAEQCLGAMPPELLAEQKDLFKDRLLIAVRKQFLGREEFYALAGNRMTFAEQLCKEEQRGDMAVIIAAALLMDCDTPSLLLEELKADQQMIEGVNKILQGHPPQSDDESISADIFHDACLLANIQAGSENQDRETLKTRSGEKTFNNL